MKIPDLGRNIHLRKLNLYVNQFTHATFPAAYSNLTALRSINLNENINMKEIKKTDFIALREIKLEKLSIESCSLEVIENGTFRALPNIRSLVLAYNKQTGTSMKNLINGLQGSYLNTLDLSGVIEGQTLPSNTFDALVDVPLYHLKLRHSHLDFLMAGTFRSLSVLRTLDLTFSRISLTNPGAFRGLARLQNLLLAHNKLEVFPTDLPTSLTYLDISYNKALTVTLKAGMVDTLHSLTELDIHHCGLQGVANDAFNHVVHLRRLDLSNNVISHTNIESEAFKPLVNLKILDLGRNKLQTFQSGHLIFRYLANLTMLDMSSNKCKMVASDSFTGLSKLKYLNLSCNSLDTEISQKGSSMFATLANLISLDISSNGIQAISPGLFGDLKKLTFLRLDYNYISKWEPTILANLKSLTALSFANNHISVVYEGSFDFVEETLQMVNLSGNPFSCSCALIWFRHWINTTNITLVHLDSYTCSSPKNMVGKKVLSFNPLTIVHDGSCLPWEYITIGAVIGLGIVICIICLGLHRRRWQIRLWWYLRVQKKREREGDDKEDIINRDDDDFKYDCFVSVGYSDEDWVKDVLLPKMDSGQALPGGECLNGPDRYSLCCDCVHLLPGNKPTLLQIADAIMDSRKVLILLTKKYLQEGQQMEFELPLALQKVSTEGWGAVILVVLEAGADVRIPHGKLHELLDNGQQLEYPEDSTGQEVFWKRLADRLDAN